MLHQESTSFIIVVKVAGYKLRGMMSSMHKQGSKRTCASRAAGGPAQAGQQEESSFIIVIKVAGNNSRGMRSSLHKQGSKRTCISRAEKE